MPNDQRDNTIMENDSENNNNFIASRHDRKHNARELGMEQGKFKKLLCVLVHCKDMNEKDTMEE